MKTIIVFIVWTVFCLTIGFKSGENSAQNNENKKKIVVYQQKEKNTLEQEKTACNIKVKYERFKSNDEECAFVLNYDVNKCLPK